MAEAGSVAVIGSGITGLSAAWLLQRSGAKVALYEKDPTFGGHTLTDDSAKYPVDLGFQVFNYSTYPHFVGMLETLGVDSEASEMSFALSVGGGELEWGSDPPSIFAQRKNLLSPSFWRMIADVVRFGRKAPEVLDPKRKDEFEGMTLAQYLRRGSYSEGFVNNYCLPMCAAVWSVPNQTALEFPVTMLIRFWVNHHLLDVVQRPCWRVVKNRSRSYVNRILDEMRDVSAGDAVTKVERLKEGGVAVHTASGTRRVFDHVIMATHSDQSLKLLGDGATAEEKDLLKKVPYNPNDVYLHTDEALMPKIKGTWSAWNCLEGERPAGKPEGDKPVCVTYWANKLQNLPEDCPPTFVTLNPITEPEAGKVLSKHVLDHPVFSFDSVAAQAALPSIQGKGGVWYAGAWCGYGFHEDGIRAAVEVATKLGARVPWEPRITSPKMGLWDMTVLGIFDKAAKVAMKTGRLRVILPNGEERVYGSGKAEPEYTQGLFKKRELSATLRVHDMGFFQRLVTRHDTGMGEAWMFHECESPDLGALMAVMTANAPHIEASRKEMGVMNWVGDKLLYLAHLRRDNTVEGSRKNIEEHYDAGNAMYKLFLDETMTYSAGIHEKDCTEPADLADAQFAKIDDIIKRAGLKKGEHVLEVGCGWGAFAMRAAETTGCRVTGITISKEQLAEATARVKANGLDHLVNLIFCDYRYSPVPGAGTYDKVVSIEMIEAVGHNHLPEYFQMIGSVLRPGGKAVIQAITEPDHRYELYCNSSDFIREHIFPGGHLPCMGAMVDAAQGTGLSVSAVRDIGPDYAVTLEEWRRRWMDEKEAIKAIGYSEQFHRKYEFYFAYCEAAFEYKYIHDYIITWQKDGDASAPAAAAGADPTAAARAVRRLSEAGGGAAAGKKAQHRDVTTQALCAVYFFLAGMAVGQKPRLWLLPAMSLLCAALFYVVASASKTLLPAWTRFTTEERDWWCAHSVATVHALATSALTACYVSTLLAPETNFVDSDTRLNGVLAMRAGAAGEEGEKMAYLLVCGSAGFLAYQLWTVVLHGLARTHAVPAMLHHVVMVCCLGGAVYKEQQTAFLALTLVSSFADVGHLSRKLMRMAGLSPSSKLYTAAWAWTSAFAVVSRLVPHLALTAMLLAAGPSHFAHREHFALALAGLLVSNACNVRLVSNLRKAYRRDCKAVVAAATPPAPIAGTTAPPKH